jgi:hypothetical protein
MGRCIKMKEVYVVVVEQETVVCVMDSAEKAEKVVDKRLNYNISLYITLSMYH